MAAPSQAEVEELIQAAVQIAATDINDRFGALLREHVSRQDAASALILVIANAKQEFEDSRQRIDDFCTGFNGQLENHKKDIDGIVTAFQASTTGLTDSVNSARVETKLLSEEMAKVEGENTKLREDLGIEFGQQTATIKSV